MPRGEDNRSSSNPDGGGGSWAKAGFPARSDRLAAAQRSNETLSLGMGVSIVFKLANLGLWACSFKGCPLNMRLTWNRARQVGN